MRFESVLSQDCKNMGAKNVMVVTDGKLAKMRPVQTVIEALEGQGVPFKLYDKVAVEPTDERFVNNFLVQNYCQILKCRPS